MQAWNQGIDIAECSSPHGSRIDSFPHTPPAATTIMLNGAVEIEASCVRKHHSLQSVLGHKTKKSPRPRARLISVNQLQQTYCPASSLPVSRFPFRSANWLVFSVFNARAKPAHASINLCRVWSNKSSYRSLFNEPGTGRFSTYLRSTISLFR